MTEILKRLVREDQGQDLIEYALLAAFIALSDGSDGGTRLEHQRILHQREDEARQRRNHAVIATRRTVVTLERTCSLAAVSSGKMAGRT